MGRARARAKTKPLPTVNNRTLHVQRSTVHRNAMLCANSWPRAQSHMRTSLTREAYGTLDARGIRQ
eukprot:12676701-Alexandrium_andersonii.AAC.1